MACRKLDCTSLCGQHKNGGLSRNILFQAEWRSEFTLPDIVTQKGGFRHFPAEQEITDCGVAKHYKYTGCPQPTQNGIQSHAYCFGCFQGILRCDHIVAFILLDRLSAGVHRFAVCFIIFVDDIHIADVLIANACDDLTAGNAVRDQGNIAFNGNGANQPQGNNTPQQAEDPLRCLGKDKPHQHHRSGE